MFYLIRLMLVISVTVPLCSLTILVGIFDPHGKQAYRINALWSWLILKIGGVRLKVSGIENIDPDHQYLFIVNHQSNIDIPVLVQALGQFQLRWIAKKELLWVPIFGWAMWATKHIIVDRSDSLDALKSLDVAKRRIAAGLSVVIFPEGTRSADGKLLPFKRGGFLLALKTKTPIVPITINGTRKILPKGDWRIRDGEISIAIGAPLSSESYRPGGSRALSAQVQELIVQNLAPNDCPGASEQQLARPNIAAQGRPW